MLGTPGEIFKSTNNGDNWALFGSGLPDDDIEHLIRADNDDLYAGTYESGVYCSTDDGANWSECNNGLPENAMVTAMLAGPNDDLFTATWPEGVFRSTDNGNQWEPFNNGLPFSKVPIENPGFSVVSMIVLIGIVWLLIYIFATYWLNMGDYMDMDYSWIALNDGLPEEFSSSCMAAGGPDNKILLGSYEHGLYRNALPVDIEENKHKPSTFNICNYPNPARNSTTFKITVPALDKFELNIYNQLGQKVETVLDEELEKGQHEISWSIKNLSAGIYYYTFSSGNIKYTDKLIVE